MASVLTAPSTDRSTQPSTQGTALYRETTVKDVHNDSAPHIARMGKAVTVKEGLNWVTLTTITIFHIGAVAAFFFFSWQRLAVMAILYVLAINVGIGMCYHRLLPPRGYNTPLWIEYIMSVFATMALEGGPIFW